MAGSISVGGKRIEGLQPAIAHRRDWIPFFLLCVCDLGERLEEMVTLEQRVAPASRSRPFVATALFPVPPSLQSRGLFLLTGTPQD